MKSTIEYSFCCFVLVEIKKSGGATTLRAPCLQFLLFRSELYSLLGDSKAVLYHHDRISAQYEEAAIILESKRYEIHLCGSHTNMWWPLFWSKRAPCLLFVLGRNCTCPPVSPGFSRINLTVLCSSCLLTLSGWEWDWNSFNTIKGSICTGTECSDFFLK